MSDTPTGTGPIPYFGTLIGSIEAGELHCTAESLGKLAQNCQAFTDELRNLREKFIRQERLNSGWGQLPSGRAIAQHFADKEAEMVSVLDQHIAIVERMEAFFVSTRDSYLATEAANSAPFQLGSFGPT
ncbi:hypothetical protein [Hoyosella subflava]|uniref:Uncharacterized protein n=1 Tax=Hoyosella subflava (strain DSM 45089 / JCM 17490 / NBRC 109087 / DQS3-9A1) TaxID=443218 RepID=F6EIB4_HOYSD|nr:hypothetical protein [Hoyosella subflava]AEF41221.1 hypothetical protein AS9A_2774 [Hoyosella subflava DQS3-9A1]